MIDLIINITSPVLFVLGVVRYSAFVSKDYFRFFIAMNINKFLHSPNVAGQSLVDRVTAAKHSLAGERLAKFVCKATTEEQTPPKKKHIDRKLHM